MSLYCRAKTVLLKKEKLRAWVRNRVRIENTISLTQNLTLNSSTEYLPKT